MPKGKPKKGQISDVRTLATDGTMVSVAQRPLSANTGISAKIAGAPIELMSVRKGEKEQLDPCAKHPHYMRGLLLDDEEDMLNTTSQYSLTNTLVPQVPIEESSNKFMLTLIFLKSIAV
jgi:hypothetical protein